jgi:hypothetical protein
LLGYFSHEIFHVCQGARYCATRPDKILHEGVGVIAIFGFRQVNRRGRLGGLTLL